MLSTILVGFLFSPALTYAIGLLITLAILIVAWIEWNEYSIRKKLIKQNIRYVRLPSLNMALMRGKRIDLIEMDLSRKYGKVFGGNMLNEPVIYVTDPELAQIILTREFTKFANRRVSNAFVYLFPDDNSVVFPNRRISKSMIQYGIIFYFQPTMKDGNVYVQ